MPSLKSPRKGSLQFWPRKRALKFLPSVNWDAINSGKNLLGFIAYKAGMTSLLVKDETPNSMTKGKKIIIPGTILVCPPMKILSIRFYKNGKTQKEVLAQNLEKELKRKIKLPKKKNELDKINLADYDDLRLIVYSNVKKTELKKTPDILEVGLFGTLEEKFNFAKSHLEKEILIEEVFEKKELVDLRGLTKGKGLVGPLKRFGLQLKAHKSEKGRRRPGSLGPWHPARVTFRAPMAGQMGMFSRVIYNNKILEMKKSDDKIKEIKNFGKVNGSYVIVSGSVMGPAKRQIILTKPLRISKEQKKKEYELIELR